MVTKRPCILIVQINGFSGMTYRDSDRHSYAHSSNILTMVATRFQ